MLRTATTVASLTVSVPAAMNSRASSCRFLTGAVRRPLGSRTRGQIVCCRAERSDWGFVNTSFTCACNLCCSGETRVGRECRVTHAAHVDVTFHHRAHVLHSREWQGGYEPEQKMEVLEERDSLRRYDLILWQNAAIRALLLLRLKLWNSYRVHSRYEAKGGNGFRTCRRSRQTGLAAPQ